MARERDTSLPSPADMGIDVGDASSAHYAHLLTIAGVEAWLDARALAHENRQVGIALLQVWIEPFHVFPVKERCFSKLYNLKAENDNFT